MTTPTTTPAGRAGRPRAAGLLLALAAAATPATAKAAEEAYQLGEVVVTADKPVVESTETVREVSSEQIDSMGARTLDEALALMPGVDVRVGGDGTPRIDVRGLRTRHVKLLINGIPFNSAADGQFDPTLIPTEQIARIKMTMGGGSELYGDGALAAVINIVTKQGSGPPHGTLTTEIGDGGEKRLVGTFSAGSDKGGLFITASHLQRDGWPMSGGFTPTGEQGGGLRRNSDRRRENLYANGTYSLGADWQLGFSFNHVEGDHGVPSSVINDPNDLFAMTPHYDRVDDEGAYYLQVDALYAPEGPWSNHGWAYLSTQNQLTNRYPDSSFTNLDDPSVMNTFHDDSTSWIAGFHNQLAYAFRHAGSLAFMVDFREERLDEECRIRDVPISLAPAAPAAPSPAAPSTYTLDFTDTTTGNNTAAPGATTAGGGNDPVARLTLTDRPGGGVDFSLADLATNNFGAGSYVSRLFLLTDPAVDLTGLGLVAGSGSQASFGPASYGSTPIVSDGYDYFVQVNFQKPGGAGDPLLQGETALWSFNKGTVADFISKPAVRSGSPGPDMLGSLVVRGVDTASWNPFQTGAIPGDRGGAGQNNVPRVTVQAPPAATPSAPVAVTPGLGATTNFGCGGGDGSGGGQGIGGGTGQVVRVEGATFGLRTVDTRNSTDVLSAAVEYSVKPFDFAGVVLGYGGHWQVRGGGTVQADTSYDAGVYVDATSTTRLHAAVSRKIRVPTATQLYDQQFGNPNLAFERAQLYEAGLDQRLGRLGDAGITGFFEDVSGLIQRDAFSGLYANIARSTFQGFEVTADTHPLEALDVRIGYSYLITRDESPGTARQQIQYTPSHKVTLETGYAFGHGLKAHASFEYVADQFFYSRGGVEPLLKGQLGDYGLVNLKLDYSPFRKKTISFYVGADNLLDAAYEQAYGLPQAGRFVYGGIKLALP